MFALETSYLYEIMIGVLVAIFVLIYILDVVYPHRRPNSHMEKRDWGDSEPEEYDED